MTSSNHLSGMDRIAEAARILDLHQDTPIVNLQGDEPFMPVKSLINYPLC
jgi:3-deoxy-manno-octulosonate cytidylyltransferase (CMP-KDO synthetase)